MPSHGVTRHAGTKVFSRRIPRTLPLLTSVTTDHICRDLGKRFSRLNVIMTQPCSCDQEQHAVISLSVVAGPKFRFASRAHLRVCVQIANSRALSDAEAYSLPGWAHYPMLDFHGALSAITTITDLIPVQWLFVFNGTSSPRALPAVSGSVPSKGARALMCPSSDLPRRGEPGPLRAPVLAAQSLLCAMLAGRRDAVPAVLRHSGPGLAPRRAYRRSPRLRGGATPARIR
jgi:hypothetical protein